MNNKIELTSKLLNNAKTDQKKTLSALNILQGQIDQRNELIDIMKSELTALDSLIDESEKIAANTQHSLDSLETEYGEMMRLAIRQKLQDSRLQFILAGGSITEYYNRWRFLKAYHENRAMQFELMIATKEQLKEELIALRLVRDEKKTLLSDRAYQNQMLTTDLVLKANTLKLLKKNESELKSTLANQEKIKKDLDRRIQNAITAGIAKAKKNAKPRKSETNKKLESNSKFGMAKGKLSWPVQDGVVVKKFGTQAHPTLKGISIINNGIDIRSIAGAPVKSVFAGEVAQLQNIPGYASIIVISHENYYTVYSNLNSTSVHIGDKITMGQTIGHLGSSEAKGQELHFEIWKEKLKLNPLNWIKK